MDDGGLGVLETLGMRKGGFMGVGDRYWGIWMLGWREEDNGLCL